MSNYAKRCLSLTLASLRIPIGLSVVAAVPASAAIIGFGNSATNPIPGTINSNSFSITNDAGGPDELTVTFTGYDTITFDAGGAIDVATQGGTLVGNNSNFGRFGFAATRVSVGQGFSVSFDKDVLIESFAGRATSGRTPDITIQNGSTNVFYENTTSAVIDIDAGGTNPIGLVLAGTEVFFVVNSDDGDRSDGFEQITVNTVIPEPATLALLSLAGLTVLSRPRRST